jgi:hypothetical protein
MKIGIQVDAGETYDLIFLWTENGGSFISVVNP